MDDLIAFVSARLDEDEAAARVLCGAEWEAQEFRDNDWAIRGTGMGPRAVADTWKPETAQWIASHDPARALREVQTWRRLLLEYSIPPGTDAKYGGTERETGFRLALSFTLKLKVMEWRDHPDYREDWLGRAPS